MNAVEKLWLGKEEGKKKENERIKEKTGKIRIIGKREKTDLHGKKQTRESEMAEERNATDV